MKTKAIKINPYHMELIIVQTDDFNEFFNEYAAKEDRQKADRRVGFIHDDEDTLYAVFCKDAYYSDIVHECVHLTNEVFKWAYIEKDLNNDEAQAYLTAWFFEEIDDFLFPAAKKETKQNKK